MNLCGKLLSALSNAQLSSSPGSDYVNMLLVECHTRTHNRILDTKNNHKCD
jgi:hypothetical protein